MFNISTSWVFASEPIHSYKCCDVLIKPWKGTDIFPVQTHVLFLYSSMFTGDKKLNSLRYKEFYPNSHYYGRLYDSHSFMCV